MGTLRITTRYAILQNSSRNTKRIEPLSQLQTFFGPSQNVVSAAGTDHDTATVGTCGIRLINRQSRLGNVTDPLLSLLGLQIRNTIGAIGLASFGSPAGHNLTTGFSAAKVALANTKTSEIPIAFIRVSLVGVGLKVAWDSTSGPWKPLRLVKAGL